MVSKLLSPVETAEILVVCTKTFRIHVNAGEIAHVNNNCGTEREHWLVHQSDLQAFVESCTRGKPS
ncbi:helix-turn-helix domain-containing protein [Methylobacterium sp. NFXW15]|uniref:helix-turn-helix domain-containing protein n=1 Tax=Methylobacterium sp. NFXW15 TaxID=2819512 RepID=UPI003CE679DD